jgi:hypothetical protein
MLQLLKVHEIDEVITIGNKLNATTLGFAGVIRLRQWQSHQWISMGH